MCAALHRFAKIRYTLFRPHGVEAVLHWSAAARRYPFRSLSVGYVLFGGLVERRIGRVRLFMNAENLAGVRQARGDPLIRPSQAADGRWTVDAWARSMDASSTAASVSTSDIAFATARRIKCDANRRSAKAGQVIRGEAGQR